MAEPALNQIQRRFLSGMSHPETVPETFGRGMGAFYAGLIHHFFDDPPGGRSREVEETRLGT